MDYLTRPELERIDAALETEYTEYGMIDELEDPEVLAALEALEFYYDKWLELDRI